MIFGTVAFTLTHVIISLVGIATGFIVLSGMLSRRQMDGMNTVFLATTVGTSVTGFLFPFQQFLPSHAVGILSLIVLAIAVPARYTFHLAGPWQTTYIITAMISLYFNVFVLVVQLFRRVPPLQALAPTQAEPPFLVAQLAVLAAFIFFTAKAVARAKQPLVQQTKAAAA